MRTTVEQACLESKKLWGYLPCAHRGSGAPHLHRPSSCQVDVNMQSPIRRAPVSGTSSIAGFVPLYGWGSSHAIRWTTSSMQGRASKMVHWACLRAIGPAAMLADLRLSPTGLC